MSSHGNISVLLEAKNEYSKHLVGIFKEHIIRIIKSIYIEAEEICIQENTPENIFMVFQDNLSKIKNWSGNKLNNEYNEINRRSGCDWLDDLIKVIFVTNVKIMTMANKIKKGKEINVKIPAGTQILYLCILDSARKIWTQPYLFNKRNNIEYQRNINEVNSIVENCIHEVLRTQLPVKNILQEYLDLEVENADTKFEVNQKIIKKMVNKDLTELHEPKNKYKSKIAELLATPSTPKILPHNPETDLIDDPSIEQPVKEPTIFNKAVVVKTPIVAEEEPVKALGEKVAEPEPIVAKEIEKTPEEKVADAEPVKVIDKVTEPVVAKEIEKAPEEKIAEPEPVKIIDKLVEPVVLNEIEKAPEQTVAEPVVLNEIEKAPEQTVAEPEPVKEIEKAPEQTVAEPAIPKQTTAQTLDSLLSSAELADLDLELEEYSIDTLVRQKKELTPIKVKKQPTNNFVFFKGAPKFPG